MMKKRIILIITILILVILMILGSLYFISYSDESQASLKYENEVNTISENILNEIETENEDFNEIQNSDIEETSNIEIQETVEEKQEVIETKQETQVQEKENTKVPVQTQSSPSNNNTQKTEPVKQSTTTVETSTQPPVQTTPEPTNNENSKVEEKQPEPVVERCTNNNNHGMDVGNSGRWFNSKSEAIAYYDSQTKLWGDKWENFEIDDDTYYKNCPSGYEVWTCMFCGKWTINFYYR